MKFGISLQNRGAGASPENLAMVARRAEELGFDSAFVGDHVVIPDSSVSEYPYSATGGIHGDGLGGVAGPADDADLRGGGDGAHTGRFRGADPAASESGGYGEDSVQY